jgi:NTE family protein
MDELSPIPVTVPRPPKAPNTNPLLAGYDRIALVLQGGGALGAYQAGVYNSLTEAGCEPNWVTGVSIGAINAALIAGNPPELRLERMKAFWQTISGRRTWLYTPEGDFFRVLRNQTSAVMTTMLGQPGFFKPRQPGPWLSPDGAVGATSYYDTDQLRETLINLVDFDRINAGKVRFSVGAVNVVSGNFIYFDNAVDKIEPEHIMASGALPPALPAVKIDGEYYWDGGIVSNTPLQHLLEQDESLATLVFQVDLFSARGTMPRNMRDVMGRHKDIMYSSRTRYNTDMFRRTHAMRLRLARTIAKLPPELRSDEDEEFLKEMAGSKPINIVHLIYQQRTYEGDAKDFEFSGTSMREHWESGYDDAKRTLRRKDWLAMPAQDTGVVVHDVHRDAD